MRSKLSLLTLSSTLLLSPCRGQEVPAQPDMKLEFLPSTAPALAGYLGDPQLGLELRDWHMEWHPSGRLVTSNKGPFPFNELLVQVWTPPTLNEPARCQGSMSVGYPWALSTSGDLICARVYPAGHGLPPSQPRDTFSCFRFAAGSWQWTLAIPGEQLRGICFSKDDSKVLVVSIKASQGILRILNAASGEEDSRLPLPAEDSFPDSPRSLAAWKDGFLMLRRSINGKAPLLQVRVDPLSIQAIPADFSGMGQVKSFNLSRDERWLVVYGDGGYEVLAHNTGQWQPWLDDRAGGGSHDIATVSISSDSRLLLVASEREARVIDMAARKVVRELQDGSKAAAFAPDDSMVVSSEHSGLGWWDTTSWTYREPPLGQHDCPVQQIIALKDNRTMISKDHNGFIVWDLPTRKARAILKSNRSSCFVGRPALAHGDRESPLSSSECPRSMTCPASTTNPIRCRYLAMLLAATSSPPATEQGPNCETWMHRRR